MRIVVAMDSFKGSLRAGEACDAVRRGIVGALPDADVTVCPMADGGEGTALAVTEACGGERIECAVEGPLPGMRVTAGYVWLSDVGPGALVEMAEASGLALLDRGELDPLRTTTFGTGELIRAALAQGARRVWLAIGGSATVDGGVGAARALGWRFLDRRGRDVVQGGGGLEDIARIVPPASRLGVDAKVEVLCDVENPLLGELGAARVFGPQKGADAEVVERLEVGLANLADTIERDLGREVRTVMGAGAAGGLGAGALAFLDATLVPGVDAVMKIRGLDGIVAGADWVVTGEGRLDKQSLAGKVVSGVTSRASAAGAQVAVIAGQSDLDSRAARDAGIEAVVVTAPTGVPEADALVRAAENVEAAASRWAASLLD